MTRVNQRIKSEDNTGFGTNSDSSGGRFYNRTGGANVRLNGVGVLSRYSWYHTMLQMPRAKFILLLLGLYVGVNLVFASIYYIIGINHLAGINTGSPLKNFTEVFFFSAQTFTTVGYGRISPTGVVTSTVSTLEAFLGLLSFAIATGLFYGRFSRPRAFLRFSENALIAPYKHGAALMFRMAPYKNNHLSEAEVRVTAAMRVQEDGHVANRFYSLDLEISKVNSLALSWTLVHHINEKSPLYHFTLQDMMNVKLEILVFVKAFDEVFSNTVMSRTSYIVPEFIWGAKFKMMYRPSQDRNSTILDMSDLNAYERVSLPEPVLENVS